ncbi:hypothetical protein ABE10_31545 [Bacillus toyonensis]|nr:hypothetical protein [Bacillus toyonensis]
MIAVAVSVPHAAASGILAITLTNLNTLVESGTALAQPIRAHVADASGDVVAASISYAFTSTDGGTVVVGGETQPGGTSPVTGTTGADGVHDLTGIVTGKAGAVTVVATATTADGRSATSNPITITISGPEAGSLYAWGRDGDGQIIQGFNGPDSHVLLTWKNKDRTTYTGKAVQLVSAWSSFTILKSDGSVWSAGDGNEGQLGNGQKPRPIQPWPEPARLEDGSPLVGVDRIFGVGGQDCTTIAFKDGMVYGTGEHHAGGEKYDMFAIGNNGVDYYYSYVPIGTALPGGGLDIKDVSISGFNINFFLMQDGRIYAAGLNAFRKGGWGSTNTGDKSTNTTGYKTVKTADGNDLIATMLATNERHSVFVGADGAIYGSGLNESGALPGLTIGRQYEWATPLEALPEGTPVKIWSGYNRTFVKSSNGKVYAAGGNNPQPLGTGSTNSVNNSWAAVKIDDEIIDVSSSNYYWSGFLTATGKVYFAGNGGEGQAGNGQTGTYATPTLVPLPAGMTRATLMATTHEGAFSAAYV